MPKMFSRLIAKQSIPDSLSDDLSDSEGGVLSPRLYSKSAITVLEERVPAVPSALIASKSSITILEEERLPGLAIVPSELTAVSPI